MTHRHKTNSPLIVRHIFLLMLVCTSSALAQKETKPSIAQASSIDSITAWFISGANYPPSGNAALFDGYPSAQDACTSAGAVYIKLFDSVPHMQPHQLSLAQIYDSYTGGMADYFFKCLIQHTEHPDILPTQFNQTSVRQLCPVGYTLNTAKSPNKNPYVSRASTTTTLECTSPVSCPPVNEGEPKFTLDPGGMTCSRELRYELALTPQKVSIEPGQAFTFTVTVADESGNPPDSAIPTSLKVEVDATSGGHEHGEIVAERPKGTVSPMDGNNTFEFTFKATEVSGVHTITATCNQCLNKTETAEVEVKVAGLEPIPASDFYVFIGKTDKHSDNYYLTPEAAAVLWKIALSYQFEQPFKLQDPVTGKFTVMPPVLHVNDASLKWGGLFDIYGKWASPHVEHRRGTVVDIRANALPTGIPEVSFKEFKSLAADYGSEAFLEAPDIANRHFHLRIFNRKE